MKEGEYTYEYCKYVFNEDEKKDIASEMAQNVSDLAAAEDEKKAIMSDFKSRIDGLQARVNGAATKLNNGYEMKSIKCEVEGDWTNKIWLFRRQDNYEVAKKTEMKSDDLQRKIDE